MGASSSSFGKSSSGIFLVVACVLACTAPGRAGLADHGLVNGDLGNGLTGWTVGSIDGGVVGIVQPGTCYSYNNTLGLTWDAPFAVNIRSSSLAPTTSVGFIMSDEFLAGDFIAFKALSENEDGDDARSSPAPVDFEVVVLDATGTVRSKTLVQTAVVTLNRSNAGPCAGQPRNGSFSSPENCLRK